MITGWHLCQPFWSLKIKHMDANISKNERQNGIEIKFPGKPDDATLAKLHSWGFRWARFNKVWYKRYSEAMMQEVKDYFGGTEVQSAKEYSSEGGISIVPDTKIYKNSAFLPYIIDRVVSGTEYYMVYDDPFPTRDNEPVSVEHIKSELNDYRTNKYKYSGSYMRYKGDGEFSYSIHSNHHLNFKVDGVTDKVIDPDLALKAYNFYVPMEAEIKHGGFELKDQENKQYHIGDRVVFSVWGYRKTGTITKDKTHNMRTSTWVFGGEKKQEEVKLIYYYSIKSDSGIEASLESPRDFRLMEQGELPELTPDIMVDKDEYKIWPVVFSEIISKVRSYHYDIKKSEAAKKPENIRSWQRSAEITKSRIIQLMTDWYWWENQYIELGRYVAGETEEQQSTRRMLWSKIVLPENKTELYKNIQKTVDQREPNTTESNNEEPITERTIELTKIEPKGEEKEDDFINKHIIVGKIPPIEQPKKDEFIHRVFIVHKDESPTTEFENLTAAEASEKYNQFVNDNNTEIINWEKSIYNKAGFVIKSVSVKMQINKSEEQTPIEKTITEKKDNWKELVRVTLNDYDYLVTINDRFNEVVINSFHKGTATTSNPVSISIDKLESYSQINPTLKEKIISALKEKRYTSDFGLYEKVAEEKYSAKAKAEAEAESMIIILQLEAEAQGWFGEPEKMGSGGLFSKF